MLNNIIIHMNASLDCYYKLYIKQSITIYEIEMFICRRLIRKIEKIVDHCE